ncbi:MAG: RNA-binding protein [Armatimonadetes bacterium]|nr:RNA-binding protein [Armatimonadota bacterium]
MTKRLFVGNLSFDISEADLQNAFAEFGASSATIPITDSGRPKGFGFVDVPAEQMNAAITAMNGKELKGRAIAVNEARPRLDQRSDQGGGRGGYRGGTGGGTGGGSGTGGGRGRRW